MAKIKIEGQIEGVADIGINRFQCVCGHCSNTDSEKVLVEFNFLEQRVIYICSKCKQENSMVFGKEKPPPYPRLSIGR